MMGSAKLMPVPNGFKDTRSVVAVDIFKDYLVMHLSDGRQIRFAHAANGHSVYYSRLYDSLKIQPIPFQDLPKGPRP